MGISLNGLISPTNGWTTESQRELLYRARGEKIFYWLKGYGVSSWLTKFTLDTINRIDQIIDLDFSRKSSFANTCLDIRLANGGPSSPNAGYAELHAGYIHIVSRTFNYTTRKDDQSTFVHELGHALGLHHPFGKGNNKRFSQDDTVMSYREGKGWRNWYSESDLKALLRLWGKEDDHIQRTIKGIYRSTNKLVGSRKHEKINGGKMADTIFGKGGNDIINGGLGIDTAIFSARNNKINLEIIGYQQTGDGRDWLASIENVNAGSGNDIITGNKAANTLNGENGNDKLYGAAGNDMINGGSGLDTAQFSSKNNRINLNSTKTQTTGDGRDRLNSIENVNAGSGNDVVTGNKAANTLNGENGNDRLYGAAGNDVLIGGGGKDRVWGQGGRDTFRVHRGSGYTIIEDFNNGQDRIQLGSGSSGLQLKTRGDDMYLYQRGDLMAIVEDAAGDLNRSGNFLV